ncbi:MAG: M14 family zinc carboxypeptidase [Bacteroidota bacterium]
MKAFHVFTLLLCLSLAAYSQSALEGPIRAEKCAKVKIMNVDPALLAAKGVSFIHGQFSPEHIFTGEICGNDIEALASSGLSYETLIPDISEFYMNRNLKKTTPATKEIEYNCGPARQYITPTHFSLGSMGGFFTYDETMAQLDSMRALFPQLISQKIQIGSSVENRPVYCVKISNAPDIDQTKPRVLFTALHHAMEVASVQQLVYFMYYLLENYNTDAEIKYMVDHLEIYFVPVVNPDGDAYNQQTNPNGGGTWRKNRRPNGLFNGVDLNRNYSYAFGYDELGSSSIGIHPWYRGTAAFSEPESQAVKSLVDTKNFSLEMNWHSYGNYFIYPWNYKTLLTEDSTLYEQFSRYVCMESHFRYGTCDQTYGYNSNGDADDYAYGDTGKNKIISLTAEIGSSSDGFWPAASNIEALCKQSLDMDLRYIRLATQFALVNDISPTFINNLQGKIPVEVYCLGMDDPASFQVSVTGLSPQVISTGASVSFNNMATLEKRRDSISYTLSPSTPPGTPVNFLLSISNGNFTWNDTITKIFTSPDTLFYDPADNMSLWNSSGYQVTTSQFTSAPSAFTESASGNYGMLQSSSMELITPIDLTAYDDAYLLFNAKWDIEIAYDYMQILASTDNGSTWVPLCGKFSSYGTSSQQAGQPVYDGFVKEWVKEEIPLNDFVGNQLKLKITFNSNLSNQFDGALIDDIRVLGYKNSISVNNYGPDVKLSVYPIPAKNLLNITGLSSPAVATIWDITGKVLSDATYTSGQIDINGLASGLYFIKITTSSVNVVFKFVKE